MLKQTAGGGTHAAGKAAGHGKGHGAIRWFLKLGLLGLFFICVIDSSPVPLPIPGSSDLLLVLLAAQRQSWLVLTLVATAGSLVGAAVSYHTGSLGGTPLLERYTPRRLRERIQRWSANHALLSVALPAMLPPPAPLMPFLIAAGVAKMPKRTFYTSFAVSRFLRHAFFAWLGLHNGPHIMRFYNRFVDKWGWLLLIVVWGSIAFAIVYAIITIRRSRQRPLAEPQPAAA